MSLLDDGYVAVCGVGELPSPGSAQAQIDGRLVALVVTDDGVIRCVDDTCTHANVSLAEGELDGCTLECWLHGSRFDLRTGEPSGPPATVPIAVHTVVVQDDTVYVKITES